MTYNPRHPIYPELSRLTVNFGQQDWTWMSVPDAPKLLLVEIVGRMFREHIDRWLADPALNAAVQKEIDAVLAKAKTGAECEEILEVESRLTETCGIDFRRLLMNLKALLASNGNLDY